MTLGTVNLSKMFREYLSHEHYVDTGHRNLARDLHPMRRTYGDPHPVRIGFARNLLLRTYMI